MTVQVDNESGYIIKCGDAVEDSGADGGEIVTAGGHSVVYTCTESGNQTTYVVGTSCQTNVSEVMYSDSQTCTTNNTFYEVEPLIPVQNKTIKGEFSELEVEIREVNNVGEKSNQPLKEDGETKDDKSLVEIAVQANDYDIERRSGKVPARRRMIPFKFRYFFCLIFKKKIE